ncbi:MAG: sigma-70 family RNA polymerase sigma factor [Pseudomonadota bacterium]
MSSKDNITKEYINYRGVMSSLLGKLRGVAPCDIEDILQETYIRTYQSALKTKIQYPKAFMVKTALRLATHRKNQQQRQELMPSIEDLDNLSLSTTAEVPQNGPEQEFIKLREFEMMAKAINQLPVKCRRVLILKKIYGLSQRDIAEQLGISESTVEKHVAKGLRLCVQYVDDIKRSHTGDVLPISKLEDIAVDTFRQ